MESIFNAVINEDSLGTENLCRQQQRHLKDRDRFYKDLYQFNESRG